MSTSSSIPDDYDSLKDEYIELATELTTTQTKVDKLEQELAWFRKQIFGKKSEKLLDANQLSLITSNEEDENREPESIIIAKPTIKRAKPGKKPLPKGLPRRQVNHIPPEVIGNEDKYIKIGQEMNEELNFIPAYMEVIEHIYPKYKHKNETGSVIIQDKAVYRPILKGRPGSGLLAHILVSKYCDHLPLDRQVKIFKRQKIDIPKSTMGFWVEKCNELLTPIYEKMKEQVMSGGYVLSDDTSVQVLDNNKPGTSHRGYLWTYGDLKQVVYDYMPGRSREGPHTFLKDYSGFLQTDGYAAYNDIPTIGKIIRVGCWAHARRKFFELKDVEPELTKVPLELIGKLFTIEREFEETKDSKKREKGAQTIQAELKMWLDVTIKKVLPASSIAGAIKYSLNQWEKLTVYQSHSQLKIDNNFSERCIKSAVIGRKNWLFFGSHEGGKRSATIYSLVESCKLQGYNPWEYLNDVLSRLDESPMNIEDLTPVGWEKSERA